MRAFVKRALAHPFVLMAALAALVHSTWSLATLFGGPQPVVHADAALQFGAWMRETVQLAMWLAPNLLLALAIDVGLVETAHAVRSGQPQRGAFALLALGSYFLQLMYIAHHMPALALSQGVAPHIQSLVAGLRDLAVFVLPALLQLPIALYVFAGTGHAQEDAPEPAPALTQPVVRHEHVVVRAPEPSALEHAPAPALPRASGASGGAPTGELQDAAVRFEAGVYACDCPRCGATVSNAKRENLKKSMAAHMAGRACKQAAEVHA